MSERIQFLKKTVAIYGTGRAYINWKSVCQRKTKSSDVRYRLLYATIAG